jgi:hypothetical protein
MALSLICACGARFEVEDTLAGQDVSCPECQQSITAPTLRQPTLRSSDLALASAVLALVGAFTVVGTVAAVVLGAIGLVRIRRNRDRLGGAGFAVFGIAAGTIFTVLTLLAFSSNELFGLGARLRRNMLGDRVNTSGDLTHKDDVAGFSITRPSRDWGESTVEKLDDAFVTVLQGEGQNLRKRELLLVQTARTVYADVRVEDRFGANVDEFLKDEVTLLEPATNQPEADDGRPFRGRRPEQGNGLRLTNMNKAGSMKPLDAGDGVDAREKEVTFQIGTQKWKMLIRAYYNGKRLFIVRAYGRSGDRGGDFQRGESDVRKLLDSFTILDEK